MADLPHLSRLTPVPVREVWAHEAHHFTQWLLQNAEVLSDVLGMDLDLTAAEHRVGGFALDLIGTDLQTNSTVIIENQLEPTDHGHLGQLLTYAGGTDPATIVWCAPSFRDEHRAALDWLNEHTVEGVRFFGVEINAVTIAGSLPAPMFRLIAQPNDWTKRVHTEKVSTSRADSPRAAAHEALWRLVLDRVRAEHPEWTSARAASRDSWITMPYGTSGVWCEFLCGGSIPRVDLYFGSNDAATNEAKLNTFLAHREQLEAKFGAPLDFDPMPGRTACRITAVAPQQFDVLDPQQRGQMVEWFLPTMAKFRAATQTLRKAINASR